MDTDKEMELLVAVLKGDFIAQHFPQFWHTAVKFKESDADKLGRQYKSPPSSS